MKLGGRKMNKLFKIGILTLALMLLLIGCGDTNVETPEVPNQNIGENGAPGDQAQPEETTEPPTEDVLSVGDTADFGGLKITLNGVKSSQGDEYFAPDNDKFIIIDLTIENTKDESETVSTLMQMTLMDEESFSYDVALFADTKGSVDGEIAPGRKVRGEVAFDVPQSEYYEFIFEDPFVRGQLIWRIENVQ